MRDGQRRRAVSALGATLVLSALGSRASAAPPAAEIAVRGVDGGSGFDGGARSPEGPSSPSILDILLEAGEAGGLTADDVADRAQATSFNAAAQRQALAAAEARLEQAVIAYLPRLNVSASYTRLSPLTPPTIQIATGPAGSGSTQNLSFPILLNQTTIQVGLVVPITDYVLQLSHSYASASHSVRASRVDEQAAKLSAALDGRVAFYTWLRSRAQLVVARRNLDVAKAHVVDAQNGFQVGTATRADVLASETQVARSELVVAQAKTALVAAEMQIRIATHDTSLRPYAVGEDLRAAEADGAPTLDLQQLWAEALDRRLEIRALDETAWSLREQARGARSVQYPRVEGFGDFLYTNPNSRLVPAQPVFTPSWDVGVRLSWSINDVLNGGRTSADARARALQTEYQRAALADSLRTEIVQAVQSLEVARVSISTTNRALVAAEESYRVRQELFRNGRATSVELEDSEAALFQASFESVNAHADLRIAEAKLKHVAGRDVPRGSGPTP